jgi:branched-chain amino acid aminotransferase
MKLYYNHNGKLFEVSENAISISNHSYRYGDGIFETIKLVNGNIPLANYHFERLFESMNLLGFKIPGLFTKEKLRDEIMMLAKKNNCSDLARVRVAVNRGGGGVNDCDNKLQYTIECIAADESINSLNVNGFIIDFFPDAIKSCDKFSNLKSSSYLNYVMAARYAKENKWNDVFIFNQHNRICETSIANLFWVKDEIIFTPPLSEGCVAGVMRQFLIEKIPRTSHQIMEKPCEMGDIEKAEEIFLTNAVYGMRWVKQMGNNSYSNIRVMEIYKSIIPLLIK